MQLTSYEFTARTKTARARPSLVTSWSLAGFALGVLLPLAMVFPKQELVQQASQQRLGDSLTVSYLSNLLKADPNNWELRILLAEHRIFLNELDGIPEMLAPLIDSSSPKWRAKGLLAKYKYLVSGSRRSTPGTERHARFQQQRRDTLLKLHKRSWPLRTLIYLAGQADQLHERGISSLLYRRISEASLAMTAHQFSVMARHELGEGNYQLSAHLYFIARRKANTRSTQRKYLLAGAKALLSGNQAPAAMRELDRYVGDLIKDSETLYAMIKLARAADDQQRAVKYARYLLRISSLDTSLIARFSRVDLSWIGIGNAEAASEMTPSADAIRPYGQREYELAYKVFIENGSLKDALQVAKAAVRQSPKEVLWHQRLAQLAEWSGDHKVALREQRWLYRHGGGQAAELAILRLAPGLNDYDSLLDIWKRRAVRGKLDEAQWQNLASLFEQTGRQREGIRFFRQRYAADHRQLHLEMAASMAERNGDDALARELYLLLLTRFGTNTSWVMKVANYYLREGEYAKAYALLQDNQSQVEEKDAAYWKAMADLAWQLQRDDDAARNYRRLEKSGALAREDFSRLIYLLDESRQDEKAFLAETAYLRFGDRDMLLRALEVYARRGDTVAQKRLFEHVARHQQKAVADSPRFFVLRGRYFQSQGASQLARADFFRATSLAPHDADTSIALLWLLIDEHDLPALRDMLGQLAARGENSNPAYWGVLAAANQTLDRPSRALAYYTRQFKRNGQDPLWLMNYADALEQAGQAGMASRVRRHVWLKLRGRLTARQFEQPYTQDMLTAARLALTNAPGDGALELIRAVLRQDRLLDRDEVETREADGMTLGWSLSLKSRDEELARQVNELVLGWSISTEQSANAKAWLWSRYAQMLKRPLWAETSVALVENDTTRLAALFDEQGSSMTMLSRHDVANAIGRADTAQAIIFDGLAENPDSNEAYMRLHDDALAVANMVGVRFRDEQIGGLRRLTQEIRLGTHITKDIQAIATYQNGRQSSSEVLAYAAPTQERLAGVALQHHHARWGDTGVMVRHRNEWAATTESKVDHEMQLAPHLQLQLGAEFNADSSESSDLQLFGMRNQMRAGLRLQIGKREHLFIESGWARYSTQTGAYLGSGRRVSWEAGYKVRLEYPDIGVRVNGAHSRFGSAQNGAFALPGDANVYGVCGGFGEGLAASYTHAWRPYMDLCLTRNDVSGQGYNAKLGVVGAVVGHDQLALALQHERGGANLINGSARGLELDYRYYF